MTASRKRGRRRRRARGGPAKVVVRLLRAAVVCLALASLAVVGAFVYYSLDLPGFETLEDYEPLETTRLVSPLGELVGELFMERRTVIALEEMPEGLIHAFISAEDERFYEHVGLDYLGIARAMLRNLQAGGVSEGGSTITQQVVKTFLLSPERRFSRKFREMILARRLEQNLTKDEILFLYLNQIYFGHGRHGVQEAARFYFGKDAADLDVSEYTVLAGLPRAPNLYSPRRHPNRALRRRAYVLRRMVEAGHLDEAEAEKAAAGPLELVALPPGQVGTGYIEEVRRLLTARLGSDLLLGGGLTVEVAMCPRMQAAAEEAVASNLRSIDKRQGWRGPLTHLDELAVEAVHRRFDELVSLRRGRGLTERYAFDLSDIVEWSRDDDAPPRLRVVVLEKDLVLAGLVSEVEDGEAAVDLGGAVARLRLSDMRWARPFNPDRATAEPRRVSAVLSAGDVVLVRLEEGTEGSEDERPVISATLEQQPMVEGALVAIDPANRGIVAMVGGYDAARSHFNRATQARRQPGSAFKPFVYGAALETGRYTAGSRVLDAPEIFRDRWTGQAWRPSNYDGRFDGEMAIRASLALSKNAVAVRLTDDVGVDAVIDFARRSGITTTLPRFLPISLGSGEVTPLELVNAYTTLAAAGVADEPVLVRSVRDRRGNELHRHSPGGAQEVRPEVAYVLTDLLTAVLTEGTGRGLNRLGRPTAGKTGTTDDRRDAWFVGYTPELVAGAWVGFDEPRPLGRSEYGGRAAGPAWLAFMEEALAEEPARPFLPPPNVQFVRIDPETGLLAAPGRPGSYEPYLPRTAPTTVSTNGPLSPIELFMQEQ